MEYGWLGIAVAIGIIWLMIMLILAPLKLFSIDRTLKAILKALKEDNQ